MYKLLKIGCAAMVLTYTLWGCSPVTEEDLERERASRRSVEREKEIIHEELEDTQAELTVASEYIGELKEKLDVKARQLEELDSMQAELQEPRQKNSDSESVKVEKQRLEEENKRLRSQVETLRKGIHELEQVITSLSDQDSEG